MKIRRISLRQFGHRIDTGKLQQIGILFSDALDPCQIGTIDPSEDKFFADAGFVSQGFSGLSGTASFEQFFLCTDAAS